MLYEYHNICVNGEKRKIFIFIFVQKNALSGALLNQTVHSHSLIRMSREESSRGTKVRRYIFMGGQVVSASSLGSQGFLKSELSLHLYNASLYPQHTKYAEGVYTKFSLVPSIHLSIHLSISPRFHPLTPALTKVLTSKFLAHLSRRLMVRYCDHSPSVVLVVRLSVRPFTIFKQHLLLNH